jgi:hypothetical protein
MMGVNDIKRITISSMAYVTTGVGFYYAFFGESAVYGAVLLLMGLLGVMVDIISCKRKIA